MILPCAGSEASFETWNMVVVEPVVGEFRPAAATPAARVAEGPHLPEILAWPALPGCAGSVDGHLSDSANGPTGPYFKPTGTCGPEPEHYCLGRNRTRSLTAHTSCDRKCRQGNAGTDGRDRDGRSAVTAARSRRCEADLEEHDDAGSYPRIGQRTELDPGEQVTERHPRPDRTRQHQKRSCMQSTPTVITASASAPAASVPSANAPVANAPAAGPSLDLRTFAGTVQLAARYLASAFRQRRCRRSSGWQRAAGERPSALASNHHVRVQGQLIPATDRLSSPRLQVQTMEVMTK